MGRSMRNDEPSFCHGGHELGEVLGDVMCAAVSELGL
jgi:hypothetical protein